MAKHKCDTCGQIFNKKDNLNKHYKICKEKKFNNTEELKKMEKIIGVIIAFSLVCAVSSNLYAEDQPATAAAPVAPATAVEAPAAAAAVPAAPAVTGSAELSVLNRYIFRGYELSSHSAVFQPTLTINYAGFTANLWSNIDSNEHPTQSFAPVTTSRGHNNYDETDLTLNYTYNIDKLALTGGYIYYGTQYSPETQEIYVSGTYDMIAHPTLAI